MASNPYARIDSTPLVAPVTLPKFAFIEPDIEAEAREAAERVAERKIIRAGVDAWQAIGKAETYENWRAISAALAIGRDFALRSSGANAPNGRQYTLALKGWLDQNFGRARPMPKQFRYYCLRLHENLPEIEQWRATLPERQRQRIVNPVSVVRRWQRATRQLKSKCADDQVKAAAVTWTRLKSLMDKLPEAEIMPLWQTIHAQAAARIAP